VKNKALPLSALTCLVLALASGPVHSQAKTLPLGQVKLPVNSVTCPAGFGNTTSCFSSTISCQGTAEIGFTYGVTNRGGSEGTVVFFNGQDGTTVGFAQYVAAYTPPNRDFQTVQVIWASPWEQTGTGFVGNVKTAACRPATLLNMLLNEKNVYSGGGMCAQGASAGGAAIAYSLAEYGAFEYLNHVSLESGPVLSDIEEGCDPKSPAVTVCPGDSCLTGNQGSWQDSPEYVDGAAAPVSTWSGAAGANACVSGTHISQTQMGNWKAMSIVDGLPGTNADATFSYPRTSVSGWLCSKPPGCRDASCQNNSAAQGQLFYQNVTTPMSIYRVNNCSGTEGIESGKVPQLGNGSGLQAVIDDMVSNCHQ